MKELMDFVSIVVKRLKKTQKDTPYKKDLAEGDHFIPQTQGGKTTKENLANACRECNGASGKGGKMPGKG
ncbi:HNH endonuclease signature motif containing protein [Acinetobacter baumannii]|uniref:HNH endonuclease signature motif containing protein n=1 Tax=Acinetobacter baumannii TaxID=470 RepID=UPI003AF7A14C